MAAHEEKKYVPSVFRVGQMDSLSGDKVDKVTDEYVSYFDKDSEESLAARKRDYTKVVNHYYDLATDFYEYGWGQCFHFARRTDKESFVESLQSHEETLADAMGLKKGMKVLDVGCGVGGPMRAIARYAGVEIVGINNNDYQLQRLAVHNERAGLSKQCSAQKADFMHMPFEDSTFDAVYAIEATCHAPERRDVYKEALRVLKPGGKFACYEWCMTEKYDPTNAEHNEIKHGIEVGDALPPINTCEESIQKMKEAGFINVTGEDRVENGPGFIPWYATLEGSFSLSGFRMTSLGRKMTHNLCRVMEWTGIAPKGTVAASQILMDAADSLVASGKIEIFTPMLLLVGEKAN